MDVSSNAQLAQKVEPVADMAVSSDGMTDDLRAIRALRLLLESRMIDRTEYERRLASFKRRLEVRVKPDQVEST